MNDCATHAAEALARQRPRWLAAGLRELELPGAALFVREQAWPAPRADALFARLRAEIDWQPLRLRLFGREVLAPRLACWIGDADAVYRYSGTRFAPLPWTATTAWLRDELAARLGIACNSVLANLYRDGNDAMGWHSDDEPELGPAPLIASLSFGAARSFCLRARERGNATRLAIELGHGSLLLMAGRTQALYQHALPRRRRVLAPRINLTLRWIEAGARSR